MGLLQNTKFVYLGVLLNITEHTLCGCESICVDD